MNIERIEFKNFSFAFDGQAPLLNDSSFEFPMNANIVLGGKSTSGRSTLLKLLAGLLSGKGGEYLINGHDVCEMSFEEFLPYRKKIGYSCDFGGLMANRTLWDNFMLPLLYHADVTPDEAEEQVTDLFRRFGVLDHRNKRPASVSGGMRKACVVARAFVMKPQMLLLDDPLVALDGQSQKAFFELVEEYRERGILKHLYFTARDEKAIDRLKATAVAIDNGRLVMVERTERKVAAS